MPHKKVGRPVEIVSIAPSAVKVCSNCFSHISKGLQHFCTNVTKLDNLKKMISDTDSRCGEQVASHVLKQKVETLNMNAVGLSQEKGRPLRVELFPDKEPKSLTITHEQIEFIKNDLNLSQNRTKRLARNLRACSKKRKIIPCGLTSYLSGNLHGLDDFFETKCIDISGESHTVLFCNDIGMLVEHMKVSRSISLGADLLFKIGIDFGGHFLKICMNMIVLNDQSPPSKKRMKYNETLSDPYKETSVNKLIILAAAYETKETYESVKELFDLLNIQTLKQYGDISIAADLKMANIMFGLMSHTSTHPCTWCTCKRYFFFNYCLLEYL